MQNNDVIRKRCFRRGRLATLTQWFDVGLQPPYSSQQKAEEVNVFVQVIRCKTRHRGKGTYPRFMFQMVGGSTKTNDQPGAKRPPVEWCASQEAVVAPTAGCVQQHARRPFSVRWQRTRRLAEAWNEQAGVIRCSD